MVSEPEWDLNVIVVFPIQCHAPSEAEAKELAKDMVAEQLPSRDFDCEIDSVEILSVRQPTY